MWKIFKFEFAEVFENYKERLVVLGTAVLFSYFMGWTTLFSSALNPFLALICIFSIYIIPYGYMFFGKGSLSSVFYSIYETKESLYPVSPWKIFFGRSLAYVLLFRLFIWISIIVFWALACAGSWSTTNFEWFARSLFSDAIKNSGAFFSDAGYVEKFSFLWKKCFGIGIYGFIDNFPLLLFVQLNASGVIYGFFYTYINTSRKVILNIFSFIVSLSVVLLLEKVNDIVLGAGPDAGRIFSILLCCGLAVLFVFLEGRFFEKRFKS